MKDRIRAEDFIFCFAQIQSIHRESRGEIRRIGVHDCCSGWHIFYASTEKTGFSVENGVRKKGIGAQDILGGRNPKQLIQRRGGWKRGSELVTPSLVKKTM
jgi:hypothetical protein